MNKKHHENPLMMKYWKHEEIGTIVSPILTRITYKFSAIHLHDEYQAGPCIDENQSSVVKDDRDHLL